MLFTLAACGDSATPIDGTTEKSDLALEQVFNNAMERQESLKSVKANIAMEQETAMDYTILSYLHLVYGPRASAPA